ncbi:MAG: branched-chain amino acid ABC transporter permease [Actinomycetes bacterium]
MTSASLFTLTLIAVWSTVAVSFNVCLGYAGILNMSTSAFLALGAYLGVRGTGYWEWNGTLTLLLAVVVAAAVSWGFGALVLRARGLYFALVTTGLALLVDAVATNWESFTGGAVGISTAGPPLEGNPPKPLTLLWFSFSELHDYFILSVGLAAFSVATVSVVMRRRQGESWKAIREDEVLAASVGVSVPREKRRVFVFTSVLTTCAGFVYGHVTGFLDPVTFAFAPTTVFPLAMVMLGGAGTLFGPILGAAFVIGLPEVLRDSTDYSQLIFGVLLLAVVLTAPRGVLGTLWRKWEESADRRQDTTRPRRGPNGRR